MLLGYGICNFLIRLQNKTSNILVQLSTKKAKKRAQFLKKGFFLNAVIYIIAFQVVP